MTTTPKSWRDILPIHPAAEMFPIMPPDELRALGEDIKKHGLQTPITVLATLKDARQIRVGWEYSLLDGRNRLDALELVGINPIRGKKLRGIRSDCGLCGYLGIEYQINSAIRYENPDDPWAYVIGANIHRRHLNAVLKRELITRLLKANPEKSDRQISTITTADHKTVGTVRAEMEGRGEIPHVETRTDTKGRQQTTPKSAPERRHRVSTAKPQPIKSKSEKALAEFKFAVDIWFDKMDDAAKRAAAAYVREKAGTDSKPAVRIDQEIAHAPNSIVGGR